MSKYVDLGISEMVDAGQSGLKLHEVDIREAIRREKLAHRDKDDVVRFSVKVTSVMVNEFDRISLKTGDSVTKITSGAVLHGLSIVWRLFEKFIVDIEDVRMKIVCHESESIGMLASSMNRSTYSVPGQTMRKTVVIPEWGTGHIAKIAKTLFMDNSTLYQVCMAYSIYTMDDITGYRKKHIVDIISTFFDHICGQDILFKSLDIMMSGGIVVLHEHRAEFDGFVENRGFITRR